MPSVLFVCSANQFRSPLAAGIFQKALAEEEKQQTTPWSIGRSSDWQVSSAGLHAAPMQPVLPDVLDVARELGIDLSSHRSQRVDQLTLPDYDLIVVMQESHKRELLDAYPELQEQVYLLSQVVDCDAYDIPDAYSSPQGIVGVCAVLNELIRRNLSYLCVLAIALHNKRVMA